MPPADVVAAMAEGAAASVGDVGEVPHGDGDGVPAGDPWGGPWTEDRFVKTLKEYGGKIQENENKIGMLREFMGQLAVKTDENAGRITNLPAGHGQTDIQEAGGFRQDLENLKELVQEMLERPRMEPRALEDMEKTVRELRENIELLWKDPQSGRDQSRDHDFTKKRQWDTRKLKLDPYGGDKKEWRGWSFTLKAYIRREAPVLEAFMNEIEYSEAVITGREVSDGGVDPDEDKELAWVLTQNTSGEMKELIQLNEGRPGCELWRLMTKESNPKSGTSGVQAMQKLMSPGRCKGYVELKKLLAKWDALLKAEVQRGGPASKMGEEVKATAIISMVPKALELEILKKGKKMIEDYNEVRTFVDDMVYMHTIEGGEAPGISLSNVEEESEDKEVEIADEQGNVLIGTLTMRNGKRIFQPRP